jgi:hypothetical protein
MSAAIASKPMSFCSLSSCLTEEWEPRDGLGNYYGKYGYDSITHAKSILISPPDAAIDHLFPPYNKEKVQALDQWFHY